MLEVDPRTQNRTIIIIGFITNVACNIYYDLYDVGDAWFFGNSFAFVCYSFVLYRLMPSFITSVLLAATSQSLIDELGISQEEALRIKQLEPEDQILEITKLRTLKNKPKKAEGGLIGLYI